ncbi:MAG TPA: DUF5985 family protein [Steroidobacteraceae bacterium]
MKQFVWGALTVESAVAALFFLRYWRVSADRLFAYFALAFGAMALNWIGLYTATPAFEARHVVYLFRLLAFILIIAGIADKNRRSGSP